MKTVSNNNVKSTNLTSKNFTIKTCAKAFEILSDGLYKDKFTSIVRELVSNAYDAHIAAGIVRPIEIVFPTEIDKNIYFIDHGIGMSEQQIMNMYTTYFDSDKTDTNEQIGGFGLGSKSPFSYTKSFMVVSSKDGMKKKFLCFVNEEGPQITKLSEEASEETGTVISFVIKDCSVYDSDYTKFVSATKKIISYNWDKPNFIETPNLDIFNRTTITKPFDEIENLYEFKEGYNENNVRVRVGIFLYNVDYEMLDKDIAEFVKHLKNFVIDINIGDIDLIASREGISYTNRTIQFLNKLFTDLQTQIVACLKKTSDTMNKKAFMWQLTNKNMTWLNMSMFGYFDKSFQYLTCNNLLSAIERDGWKIQTVLRQRDNTHHLRLLNMIVKKESEKKVRFKEIIDKSNYESNSFIVISVDDKQYPAFIKSKWMEYFVTYKSLLEDLGEKKIKEKSQTSKYRSYVTLTLKAADLNYHTICDKTRSIVYVDVFRNKSYVQGLDPSSKVNENLIDKIDNMLSRFGYSDLYIKKPETVWYLTKEEKKELIANGYQLVNYFDWMIISNKNLLQKTIKRLELRKHCQLQHKDFNITVKDLDSVWEIMAVLGEHDQAITAMNKYFKKLPWAIESLVEVILNNKELKQKAENFGCKFDNLDIDLLQNKIYNKINLYRDILILRHCGICDRTRDIVKKLLIK